MAQQAIVEQNIVRLDKLKTYFEYHNIERRYELTFDQFVKKVENGTWEAYLADNMTLSLHARALCN